MCRTSERTNALFIGFLDSIICSTDSDILFAQSCIRASTISRVTNDGKTIEYSTWLYSDLPALGKHLMRRLDIGTWSNFLGFEPDRGRVLPRFLYDIFFHIFDEDGKLRSKEEVWKSSRYIKLLLSICFFCYKQNFPHDPEQERDLVISFRQRCLRSLVVQTNEIEHNAVWVEKIKSRVLHVTQQAPNVFDLRPKHGPGAVLDLKGTNPLEKTKAVRSSWTRKLDSAFPFMEFCYFNLDHWDSYSWDSSSHEDFPDSIPSKPVFVPKDFRSPRLIFPCTSAEMYCQQATSRYLQEQCHMASRGQINFIDQSVNQNLIRQSINWCTIDLKDASDTISVKLVKEVFHPSWWKLLNASRTERFEFEGSCSRFLCFAGMGNANTFPVEAILFWAVSSLDAVYPVYVYGDDIVCHQYDLNKVLHNLSTLFCVNHEKTFSGEHFRETCGLWLCDGLDVTPVYMRSNLNCEEGKPLKSFLAWYNTIVQEFGKGENQLLHWSKIDAISSIWYQNWNLPGPEHAPEYEDFFKLDSLEDPKIRTRFNAKYQKTESKIPVIRSTSRDAEWERHTWDGYFTSFVYSSSRLVEGVGKDATVVVKQQWR